MPIYEYKCGECGHMLDALQKLADDPLKDCPECERPALKRLISAPAFRLKGGGWYETDFKSDKEKKRNLADGESKSSDDKKGGDAPKAAESEKKAKSDKNDKGTAKESSGTSTAAA